MLTASLAMHKPTLVLLLLAGLLLIGALRFLGGGHSPGQMPDPAPQMRATPDLEDGGVPALSRADERERIDASTLEDPKVAASEPPAPPASAKQEDRVRLGLVHVRVEEVAGRSLVGRWVPIQLTWTHATETPDGPKTAARVSYSGRSVSIGEIPLGSTVTATLGSGMEPKAGSTLELVTDRLESELLVRVDAREGAYLTVVLQGDDGQPVSNTSCSVVLAVANDHGGTIEARSESVTDGTGRLIHDLGNLRGNLGEPGHELVVGIEFEWQGELRSIAPAAASSPLRLPWDLGVVGPDRSDLLVAGRVVDDRGDPIAAVKIELEPVSESIDGETFRQARQREKQAQLGQVSRPSDERGRFAVHGSIVAESLSLVAHSDDHIQVEPMIDGPGLEGIELVLHRAGSLRGSIELPDPDDHFSHWVGLRSQAALPLPLDPQTISGSRGTTGDWHLTCPRRDGVFGWDRLSPGCTRSATSAMTGRPTGPCWTCRSKRVRSRETSASRTSWWWRWTGTEPPSAHSTIGVSSKRSRSMTARGGAARGSSVSVERPAGRVRRPSSLQRKSRNESVGGTS